MTFEQRLEEVFRRTLPRLAPEAREQLAALIDPTSLAIIAGVLAGWVAGHAFGYGEAIDIIVGVAGFLCIGMAIFSGLDELYLFARGTWSGASDADFDQASNHLARAIAILGIQAVLALLFKGRPRGGREPAGLEPPRGAGLRYEPNVVRDPRLPAGEGATTFWGDIEVSTAGSSQDQAVVLLHERVHQFLAPKFYLLRRFRVENRIGSYFKSALYRYAEEALAETVGQVGSAGFSKLFIGLRFPVQNGYVYLTRGGGFATDMKGAGIVPEGASLLATGAVQSFAYTLWFKPADGDANQVPAQAVPALP